MRSPNATMPLRAEKFSDEIFEVFVWKGSRGQGEKSEIQCHAGDTSALCKLTDA